MQLSIPSGFFSDNHVIWGDLKAGAIMARSYDMAFPNLSASDDETFTQLENDLRLMLGSVRPDERLQLSYSTASDFSAPIDRYLQETREKSRIEVCNTVRDELVFRYRDRMSAETLIQANVRLSLSTKLPAFVKDGNRRVKAFADVFKVMARSFEQREQFFNVLLAGYGGSAKGLDNVGHYEEMLKFWSPTQARAGAALVADSQPCREFESSDEQRWFRTISDLCMFSGLSPRQEPDHGFYMDGYYFGLFVAKVMPRVTHARLMDTFLALTLPNIRLVLNMEPISVEGEIRHEEERFNKLVSNLDDKNPSLQSEVGLEQHRDKMRLLMSNAAQPYKCQMIAIACDRTRDGLDSKLEALRAALGKTGVETYQPTLDTSSIAFFNCATPGYGPWVKYNDFYHKLSDSVNVANLMAVGSTPRADLDSADWITDGEQNNLIGGRCFLGAQPLHMLVAATTGAGKSSTLQSLALQTSIDFRFLVVIDDGLSWLTTCQKLDPTCRPIMVRADGNLTFNVFDTLGLPLSSSHLASATALCHLLVGVNGDSDKDKLRAAILTESIGAVYDAAYRAWRNANPILHYQICREAATILAFQEAEGLDSFLDAFLEARLMLKIDRLALYQYEQDVTEHSALGLDRNPGTQHLVRNLAFAHWNREMFPTLSNLQDELHTASFQKGAHTETRALLASLLRPWLRDGRYGPIVDGPGNIDLGSVEITNRDPIKVVHFEMEKIGKADVDLRAVVGFLITNEVRNHIQGMPRGIRKQVVIEEMTSFLKVPNGAEIVIDYYERMRKFSCQVISVFQQYSSLLDAHPKVAKAIIGNASQMLLLRNTNRKDLDVLSGFVHLPEIIKDKIASFPLPESMKGRDDAYAGFVLCQMQGSNPKFTVCRNYISSFVEQITSSSGDVFEEKRKETRKHVKDLHRNGNGVLHADRLLNASLS